MKLEMTSCYALYISHITFVTANSLWAVTVSVLRYAFVRHVTPFHNLLQRVR